MRVWVGERDTRRRSRPVGKCLLANGSEGVELGQFLAGNDGRGQARIGHSIGHVESSLIGGNADSQRLLY